MTTITSNITIRTITPSDNKELASIIRNTLTEFGANKPGTVFFDDATDHLFQLFQKHNSVYYVAEQNNTILGGGGIYPTEGLPSDTCELVKMYLLPESRGLGLGKLLIEKCLHFAKEAGFKRVYLETMPELQNALKAYEKLGFTYLDKPIGQTGHFGCGLWMIKEI